MTDAAGTRLFSLQERWRVCTAQDDQKASLVADLFAHINELTRKQSEVELELKNKTFQIRSMWDKVESQKDQIRQLQTEKDKHCFALALIDGDCMPFLDCLVEQGLEGGKKTASLLRQAVYSELKSVDSGLPYHLQLVVRVFVNLKGLAKTYTEMGTIPDPSVLYEFVRGFNMTNAMCDIVDAGNGKECADEKLKANFEFGLADVHCQHLFFGASADSGYARLLGSHLESDEVRRKVVLIEGPPFAKELAEIRDRFRVASFNGVFKRQKLVNIKRKVSSYITPPPTPLPDYASAAAKPPSASPAQVPSRSHSSTNSTGPPLREVLRNKAGQRVDPPLNFTQTDFIAMKNRRMCNSFHLLGRCPYMLMWGKCSHEHGDPLSQRELHALRAVARHSFCHAGLDCIDPNCVFGHQCPREACNGASCRLKFPLALHNIDKKIVP